MLILASCVSGRDCEAKIQHVRVNVVIVSLFMVLYERFFILWA